MDYLTIPLYGLLTLAGVSIAAGFGTVSIEPISVPVAVEERGHKAEVLTRQLADEMRRIREVAGSRLRAVDLPGKAAEESLEQLGEYFGIQVFVNAARRHLGLVRVAISGEVYEADGGDEQLELRLRAHVDDGRSIMHVYRGKQDQLGKLVKAAAYDAMIIVDPYVAALYTRDEEQRAGHRDLPRTYALIARCFKEMPRNEHHYVFNLWGRTLFTQGRYDEAIEKFTVAVELSPDFGAGYLNIGRSLIRLGRDQEAVDVLERALRTFEEQADVRREMAAALTRLNRPMDALGQIEKAIRAAPASADLYAIQGAILLDLGRNSDAATAYRQALRLDPTETKHQEGLSRALGAKTS